MIREARRLFSSSQKGNFLIYGVGQAFNLLSTLVVAPHIIAVCGEDGFGKVGLGFALALFLILVVDYAFDVKGTKQVAENRGNVPQLQEILNTAVFCKMILFCVALAIALILIGTLDFFRSESALFLLSMTIVLAQVFTPVWFFQGLEAYKMVSVVNIISKTFWVLSVFAFVSQSGDYVWVNLLLGISSIIANAIGLIYLFRRFDFSVILPSKATVAEIVKTDFSFTVSQLFLSVRQLSPLLLIGFFLGYHAAGQYKIIEQLITLFRTFTQVFLKFFFPKICYKMLSGVGPALAFWRRYVSINMILVCGGAAVMLIFSTHILEFFNTSAPTIVLLETPFRLSAAVIIVMCAALSLEQLMLVAARHQVYVRIAILVTIVNVLGILVSVESFGLNGVLWSVLMAEALFVVFYFANSYLILSAKQQVTAC